MNNNMANMVPMGGPVGGPPMMNNGAMPQQAGGQQRQQQTSADKERDNRTLLNTYIYEYFLRYGMYDCARAILNSDQQVKVTKEGGGRRDENGNPIGNGLGDDAMDHDSKDDAGDQKRPDDLPAPLLPMPLQDSAFLYEWFCLFWDMLQAQRGNGSSRQVNQYVNQQQNNTKNRLEHQQAMLRQMHPNQQNINMMRMNGGMPGGMNPMAMKPGQNSLPRTAMANSQNNPQAMHLLQQKAAQMQRDPSDMDGNRVRQGSPGGADNEPSPAKRQRLEGNPFNPAAQGAMMPNGRPAGQGMPGQQVGQGPATAHQARNLLLQHNIDPERLNPETFQTFTTQNPQVQAKTIATYAANLQQHHNTQMPNKNMPNPGGPVPQNQGSPMVVQGPDNANIAGYYNPPDMGGPGGMRPGPNGAQAGQGGSNHALQDYQMQLMLLEQQNKKRLMMARQEQDLTGGGVPRADGSGGPGVPGGPGGPVGPGGPNGPNGQALQGTSPQGSRNGASPNPADQMRRGNPALANAGNMGSPAPEGAQSHNSPNPMNFMGGGNQMDPNMAPHFFKGVNGMDANMAAQMNVNNNMRPPTHPGQPGFNGQINPQQMMRQQQQQPGGPGGAPMNWPGGMNGQPQPMPPQGQQPPVPQGPPQQRTAMPPPSAPAVAANSATSRNATSSPQTAAPPTPQTAAKPAPKKKETKNAKSKAATQKKTNATANAAATPQAPEPAAEPEAPTPATPMTPVVPPAFNPKAQTGPAPAQMVPNGQPQAAPAPPPPVPVAPPQQHSDATDFTNGVPLNDFDFGNGPTFGTLQSGDVLNDFDFDSFLNDGGNQDGSAFDFSASTYLEEPLGMD